MESERKRVRREKKEKEKTRINSRRVQTEWKAEEREEGVGGEGREIMEVEGQVKERRET